MSRALAGLPASSRHGPARGTGRATILTSESVAEGHPDKVCDFIADSVRRNVLHPDT